MNPCSTSTCVALSELDCSQDSQIDNNIIILVGFRQRCSCRSTMNT